MSAIHMHQSVLLAEAIEALAIRPEGVYVDATFGRGGHSRAILQMMQAKGRLFALDKDPEAVVYARETMNDPRLIIQQGSFAELQSYMAAQDLVGKVDGVLLDLGVSSPQLDNPERGFSFLKEGPLDMRMNPDVGLSAAEWIQQVTEAQLTQVLKEYGEERFARRIAKAIITASKQCPITTTQQLAEIIAAAHPAWPKHKHPATQSFQAIRIFINQELIELQQVLEQALECLAIGGRLAVITFHSLEDRIVKQFIRKHSREEYLPLKLPVRQSEFQPRLRSIGKSIKPTDMEINNNPRARSARLRVAEKIT